MSGHTPGPWVWDSTVWDYDPKDDAPWLVTEASGDRVLCGEIQCHSEADAHLIAAAPDLLAVVEAMAFELNLHLSAGNASPFSSDTTLKARAAITKATGEAT